MNILTSQQMKAKEAQLLQLYQQSDLKFKFSVQELIHAKQSRRPLFSFKKADTKTDLWIQKLVPLHKRVQTLNLEHQENALFKVLTYVFLFMIFKPKQALNHYVLEHLKCSLYSDDIDLLEIKNHSFNKKMKSDIIKTVIATFFQEIQHSVAHELQKSPIIKVQDILAFALQKNDMIVEGFHLFYRSILTKFDVEGANNCIDQVDPEQAIQNLVEYFEIDCRIFNDLYLFPESGIFLARIQQNMMFGRYYENQLYYQETSEQEIEQMPKLSFSEEHSSQNMFLPKTDEMIEKNDVKIFNFLLDTDRYSQDNFVGDKSQEMATPCFQKNDQIKFGKKTDRDMEASFSKIKNRMQDQKINEISSEQEEFSAENSKHQKPSAPNPFSANPFAPNFSMENKFLNLASDDEEDFYDSDAAPTPMLGGGMVFGFGKKRQQSIVVKQENDKNDKKSSNQSKSKKNENPLTETKEIKTSAIRRQSYQGENSSQSKSSQNVKRGEMKTSKNQIKVMDGTSSQVNLAKFAQNANKIAQEEFKQDRNPHEYEKVSSYSNCTCHQEKRNRIKLSSQIMAVSVTVTNTPKSTHESVGFENPNRKISAETIEQAMKKQVNQESRKFLFKGNTNKSTENLKLEIKAKSPVNKDQKEPAKNPQFLSFLRKDKSDLIKKLTEKRIAKQNGGNGEVVSQKNLDDGQKRVGGEKRYVKQSMFVGSYNFQNPEKLVGKTEQHNRSITPHSSIDKNFRNERSRTPTQQTNEKTESSEGMKLFKMNERKDIERKVSQPNEKKVIEPNERKVSEPNERPNDRKLMQPSTYSNYRPGQGVSQSIFYSQPGVIQGITTNNAPQMSLNMTQKSGVTIKYHQPSGVNTTSIIAPSAYVNRVVPVGPIGQQQQKSATTTIVNNRTKGGYQFYFKR